MWPIKLLSRAVCMFSVSARPQTQSFMKNIWCFNFNKSFHFNVFLLIVQNEKQPELKSYSLSFHPLICTSPALKHSHFQVHKNCIACSDFWRERWGPQPSWNREVPLHQGASKDCTRKKAWLRHACQRHQLTNRAWKTTELTGAVNNDPSLSPHSREEGSCLGKTPCQLVGKTRSESHSPYTLTLVILTLK